jgi:hypothetical protein
MAARSDQQRPLGRAASGVVLLLAVAAAVVGLPSGFGLLWAVPYGGVGALVAIRRPRTSIGWLLIAFAWAFALVTAAVDATAAQFWDGTLPSATAAFTVVTSTMGMVLFLLMAVLGMVLPSGRLPTGRWGAVARTGIGMGVVIATLSAFMPRISVNLSGSSSSVVLPNPAAVLPDLSLWKVVTPDTVALPIALLMIASVVSLFVRFRRAGGVERQQLRWITAALGFVVVTVIGGYIVGVLVPAAGASGLIWLGAIVAFPCVALAIGIAVLRYRLYEIDRIVSRTISWAIVTTALVAVFASTVVGLQALLAPVTQESTLAVAASTLLVAALFQPLRRRVQVAVDRRFHRSQVDAELTLRAFGARVREEVDLARLTEGVVATAASAVTPSQAGLWLRRPTR